MKRTISLILAFVMIAALQLSALAMTPPRGEYKVEGGYIYYAPLSGTITGCSENVTSVEIPSVIAGTKIVAIGDNAFDNCNLIESVTMPNDVTHIGGYAFRGCKSLKNVTIPESVSTIGAFAFSGCTALESVLIPNNVWVGTGTFEGCTSLSSVTIEDGTTRIGDGMFSGCSSLESITIPKSVSTIEVFAFSGCTSLLSVEIPENVTYINQGLFSYCTSLSDIKVPDSVTGVASGAFEYTAYYNDKTNWEDGVLYIGSHLIKAEGDRIAENYIIRDGTITIAGNAFWGCKNLKSVRIPESVVYIGNGAFELCTSLESVTLPDGVTQIGTNTFTNCLSLKSLWIPDSVKNIDKIGFMFCDALTDVYYAGEEADWTNIEIGGDNDELLKAAIHFNAVPSDMEYKVEGGSIYYNNLGTIKSSDKTITKAIIPEEIDGIDGRTVTKIDDMAFMYCASLKSVTIPEGVESIGKYAFNGCAALESVTIPKSVTDIDDYAFLGCSRLKDAYYQGSEEEWQKINIGRSAVDFTVHFAEDEENESDAIKVIVNGAKLKLDQEPIIENGRTLVPVRAIFEALGAEVEWIENEKKVIAVKDNITAELVIDSPTMLVNGEERELDCAAKIVNGRTLVPARAVAEAFGCSVSWDKDNKSVIIK